MPKIEDKEEFMNAENNLAAIMESDSYRLAFEDVKFLDQDELRPLRLQLELLKPDMIMNEQKVRSTIVVFGSARLLSREDAEAEYSRAEHEVAAHPGDGEVRKRLAIARRKLENSRFYEEARELGRLVSTTCQINHECDFVIVTGGGPGVMEAANRGAFEVNAKSIGLNITLPHEIAPNPYITPELCFQFRYFAIRKMHFLLRARALVAFPGGFGTFDELFETLTLIQTRKMAPLPVILFGKEFWQRAVNFQLLVDHGMIAETDLSLFRFVEKAEEAWQLIVDFYAERGEWPYTSH